MLGNAAVARWRLEGSRIARVGGGMSGPVSVGSAASTSYLNSGALWSREAMKALAARCVARERGCEP